MSTRPGASTPDPASGTSRVLVVFGESMMKRSLRGLGVIGDGGGIWEAVVSGKKFSSSTSSLFEHKRVSKRQGSERFCLIYYPFLEERSLTVIFVLIRRLRLLQNSNWNKKKKIRVYLC